MLATFQKVQIVSVMKRQKKPILVRGEQMLRNLKQNLIPNPKGHWVPIVSSQGWFALTRSVPPPLPLTEDAKKRRHCGGNHWSKVWGGVQVVQVVTLRLCKVCERTKVQDRGGEFGRRGFQSIGGRSDTYVPRDPLDHEKVFCQR